MPDRDTPFKKIREADLREMQEREEAATEGPWESEDTDTHYRLIRACEGDFIVAEVPKWVVDAHIEGEANNHFIAHSRTDQPRLRVALLDAYAEITRLKTHENIMTFADMVVEGDAQAARIEDLEKNLELARGGWTEATAYMELRDEVIKGRARIKALEEGLQKLYDECTNGLPLCRSGGMRVAHSHAGALLPKEENSDG